MEAFTNSDYWDIGWSFGWSDRERADMLATLAHELGRPLEDWEEQWVTRGWETGVREAADVARDRAEMEAAGTGPFARPDDEPIPF